MKLFYGLALLVLLAGCSSTSSSPSLAKEMMRSRDNYKACLEQNKTDTAACDSLKKIYEADVKAYNALFSSSHGQNVTVEVK